MKNLATMFWIAITVLFVGGIAGCGVGGKSLDEQAEPPPEVHAQPLIPTSCRATFSATFSSSLPGGIDRVSGNQWVAWYGRREAVAITVDSGNCTGVRSGRFSADVIFGGAEPDYQTNWPPAELSGWWRSTGNAKIIMNAAFLYGEIEVNDADFKDITFHTFGFDSNSAFSFCYGTGSLGLTFQPDAAGIWRAQLSGDLTIEYDIDEANAAIAAGNLAIDPRAGVNNCRFWQ